MRGRSFVALVAVAKPLHTERRLAQAPETPPTPPLDEVRAVTPRKGLPTSELQLLLTVGDTVVGIGAVVAALAMWSLTAGYPLQIAFLWMHAGWLAAALVWALALAPARQLRVAFSVRHTCNRIAHAALALLIVYLAIYFYAPRQALPRLMVLHFLWQASILTLAWRLVYIWLFTETSFRRRTVIVGAGRAGQAILRVIKDAGRRHPEVVGFVDGGSGGSNGLRLAGDVPMLGAAASLRDIVRREGAGEIIVAVDGAASGDLVHALVGCQEDGVDVVRMATVYEQLLERVPVEYLESDWAVTSFVDAVRSREASHFAKRALDLAGATLGLVLLAIVTPVIALAICLDSGRPIFFTQARVGQGGRVFRVVKFRTMRQGAEADGPRWAAPNDPRATRVGRWLRRMRLDELPQVLNVLLGQMSLIGPRPERPEFVAELERQIPFYRIRLLGRPGLTGWAQVNFRYADSVEDALVKLEYDLYYLKHRSLVFDARIAFRTVGAVLGLRGR